jgi:hypothetical protein
LQEAQSREDSAESLCKELEDKIKRLESPSASRRALQEVLAERVEDRRLVLEFMEWLCSMSVRHEVQEGGQDDFICTVKNPREKKVTRFSIVTPNVDDRNISISKGSGKMDTDTNAGIDENDDDDDEDEDDGDAGVQITYEPKANLDLLPDYLRQNIKFEQQMAPVLMLDVLNAMYGDEQPAEPVVPPSVFRGTGIGLGETEER